MGDIADWMIEGGGCQWCGAMIGDGDGDGYPRLCRGCSKDARKEGYEVDKFGIITSEPED